MTRKLSTAEVDHILKMLITDIANETDNFDPDSRAFAKNVSLLTVEDVDEYMKVFLQLLASRVCKLNTNLSGVVNRAGGELDDRDHSRDHVGLDNEGNGDARSGSGTNPVDNGSSESDGAVPDATVNEAGATDTDADEFFFPDDTE
jgi:hypothetical protein